MTKADGASCPPPGWLVVDIGNSRAKLATWTGGRLGREVAVPSVGLSIRSIREAVQEVVGVADSTHLAVLSCVVPAAQETWERALRGWRLHWVSHRSPLGIPISYGKPATIGPDRLVNASAAIRHGIPVVVADIGTALTVDVVLPEQGFVGGVIAPGPAAMTEYLAVRTARLPQVSLRETDCVVGRTTRQAIRAGAWFGYRGLLREIIGETLQEAGGDQAALCGTGGFARALLPGLFPDAVLEPRLTQRGLGEIGRRVFGGGKCAK